MIKISNDVFVSKFMSIQKLTNKELPFNISKVLLNTVEKLREGQREFETKRLEIAQKYATKNKNGSYVIKDGKYQFTKDAEKSFKKDHEELLKVEREYDIELIELPNDFRISTADILILKDIIIKI